MYSIWVTPSEKDKQYLLNIIQELSDTYNTCEFQPHCTLWSRVDIPLKNLIPVVESSTQGIILFTAKVKKIDYSHSYDKTLFIKLHENENLSILNQRIQSELGDDFHYQFDPHISLIYKDDINKNTKLSIISSLSVKSTFKMENVVINQTGDQIEKWKVVYKNRLKR